MAVLVPHFNLPFKLSGASFAVVEQDSYEDIANCVEAIVRCPAGFRDDSPDFGFEDTTFENVPLNIEELTSQIVQQEPRSTIIMTETPDLVDTLVDHLRIEVQK